MCVQCCVCMCMCCVCVCVCVCVCARVTDVWVQMHKLVELCCGLRWPEIHLPVIFLGGVSVFHEMLISSGAGPSIGKVASRSSIDIPGCMHAHSHHVIMSLQRTCMQHVMSCHAHHAQLASWSLHNPIRTMHNMHVQIMQWRLESQVMSSAG